MVAKPPTRRSRAGGRSKTKSTSSSQGGSETDRLERFKAEVEVRLSAIEDEIADMRRSVPRAR
jgi:hypothetical protein